MMEGKCAINWKNGQPEILWVYDSLIEADAALELEEQKTETEMNKWKLEASAALDKDELYRGGGVLVLAELMRKHSAIGSLRAGMKHWTK